MFENLLPDTRAIFSVSEVTRDIKNLLEENFSQVWITGEVSNFKASAAGHYYFTLKDDKAQMRIVMFRGQSSRLKFSIEDGQELLIHGHISVYEARGEYQILADTAEPKGMGALQMAFEQLKTRLAEEGLFSTERKRPIPMLPRRVGLITSSQGAVLHDMQHIIKRRYPSMDLVIIPVKVQGDGSRLEIVAAIELMNQQSDVDVMIVGRGGGSLEDLWAFNEEVVVRAISASRIPVISAVGHETDTTLADFAADLRAPTPSAAAELAVPEYLELCASIGLLERSIVLAMQSRLDTHQKEVSGLSFRFKDPRIYFEAMTLKLDDEQIRLTGAMNRFLQKNRSKLETFRPQLFNPTVKIDQASARLETLWEMLASLTKNKLLRSGNRLVSLQSRMPDFEQQLSQLILFLSNKKERLMAYSPYDTLKKGYALVFRDGENRPLKSMSQLKEGDTLKLKLADGDIQVKVTQT